MALTTEFSQVFYQEKCGSPLIPLGCADIGSPNYPSDTEENTFCNLPDGSRELRTSRTVKSDASITFEITWFEEGYAKFIDKWLRKPCRTGTLWLAESECAVVVGNAKSFTQKGVKKWTAWQVTNIFKSGRSAVLTSSVSGGEEVFRTATVTASREDEWYAPDGSAVTTTIPVAITTMATLPENCDGLCGIQAEKCAVQVAASDADVNVWCTDDCWNTTVQFPNAPGTANVQDVIYLPNGRVIAALADGTVMCTDDKGVTPWRAVTLTTPFATGEFVTGNNAAIVDEDGVIYFVTTAGNIYASFDDGATIDLLNETPLAVELNAITKCGDCKIVAVADTGEVYVSNTGGSNPTALTSPGALNLNAVTCCGEEIHVAASDGSVYIYANCEVGTVPEAQPLSVGKTQFANVTDMWYSADCCCRIYLGDNTAGDAVAIWSINGGANYKELALGANNGLGVLEACGCDSFKFAGDVVGAAGYIRDFSDCTSGNNC